MPRALDRIDFEILAALQNDGRISNKELAALVGLAPSTCLGRVRRLTDDGVIRGVHAEVSPDALGVGLEAMITVRLSTQTREAFATMTARLESLTEVVTFYDMSGADDFLIHVAVQDPEHLRMVVTDGITCAAEVKHVETALIFSHRRSPRYPLYAVAEAAENA
ncbi:MAG: Lrp/AsnC family transcriptional regulator [Myxococcota bacterium]|nr:Lrp/AsnC family transcriptional regulator [Myxococcota bacterium]